MEKCQCGHTHCCHKRIKRVEIKTTNEFGVFVKFIRKICADCSTQLGDKDLRLAK